MAAAHRVPTVAMAAILSAVLTAGCAGSRPSPRAATATAAAATAAAPSLDPERLLVFFKRTVGGDPTASQLTVDRDGRAAALITLGGIDGEKKQIFQMPARQLKNLKRVIERTRLRDTPCCNDFRYYVYWVSIAGHSWQLQQGKIPQSMRRLVGTLDSITNTHTIFSSP